MLTFARTKLIVRGVWNETEAWPLMFKSANTIGALPILEEVGSFDALSTKQN